MDDPEDSRFTLSFDLLFRGMEITTGGQRIHDYHLLLDKIAARGMTEERMEQYLDAFKYGMPPHGGLGIGLERLTMKLLGEENVRKLPCSREIWEDWNHKNERRMLRWQIS